MGTRINPDLTREMHRALMGANTQKYIADALPQTVKKYLTPERMARVVLATFQKTPLLWECTPASIVRSVVDAASLGLEPVGGTLAHGYLVPYKTECQFIIGYQGLIELARRSGEFKSLEANPVYENDKLTIRYGFDGTFSHEPCLRGKRGELIGAYCMATFGQNDERHVTWMSKEDIEKRRETSPTGARNRGPWSDWYDEMAVKTVIKKAAKLWPKTPEITQGLSIDEGGHSDLGAKIFEANLEPAEAEPKQARKSSTDRLLDKMQAPQEEEADSLPTEEDDEPWKKHQKESEDEDDSE